MDRLIPVLSAVIVLFAASTRDVSAQHYRVVDIYPSSSMWGAYLTELNNSMQGVGLSYNGTCWCRPFVWERGTSRLLPGNDVASIRINNRGTIAGTRGRWPQMVAFTLSDGNYTETPLPANSESFASKLTDSGLLLLHTHFYDVPPTNGGAYLGTQVSVLYGSQLYLVSGPETRERINDIGEDGVVGGSDGRGRPFLRWPDGRTIVPWNSGAVTAIGTGGHVAGSGSGGAYFGRLDGAIVPVTGPVLTDVRINGAGDLVGTEQRLIWIYLLPSVPYIYRDRRYTPLHELVSLTDRRISAARAINDLGVIVATVEWLVPPYHESDVLLIPTRPAPPADLMFTVSGRTVDLQWRPRPNALEYILEAGSRAGLSDLFYGSIGSQTSITATVPPGRYYVRLRTRDATGLSEPSSELIIDVP